MSDDESESDNDSFIELNDDDEPDEIDLEIEDGVDNTAKQNIKLEDEEEKDDDNDEEEVNIKHQIGVYTGNIPKLTEYEYSKTISELGEEIANSRITVPEESEKIIDCSSGSSKTIAKNWFNKRREVPIPIRIERCSQGKAATSIDPATLPYRTELSFNDLKF